MSTATVSPRVLELLRFTKIHRSHTDALARVTGEHFNIFQILRVGHLEVATHSPILAELLNPKGNHGQGAVFLRRFLAQFEVGGFDADSATVTMEYYVGPVTEKSGGRIDIMIKDGQGSTVLIENKIYAADQRNQMTRYREFDRKAHLFYLTLDGREPSNLSVEELTGVRCISYASDVLSWLKEGRKEAANLPTVREIISQYIHLIEELTDQSTTRRMHQKLIDEIVGSKESLEAFFTIRDADEAVRATLIARLDAKLDDLAKETGLERQGPIRDLRKKEGGFSFTTPGLRHSNLQIAFEFDEGSFHGFFFGFALIDSEKKPSPVAGKLSAVFGKRFRAGNSTKWWPAWAWWIEYRHWDHQAFEALRSGQFAEDLRAKLLALVAIAKQVCPDEEN